MKKFTKSLFFVALFLLSTVGLLAKTVHVDDAKNIAHQFLISNLGERTVEKMKRVSPKVSLSLAYEVKAQNGNSNLFVFNQAEQGFVVVAADDCISPILGYADSGAFDEKNMPESFRYWLESCSRYIEKAKAGEVKHEDMTIKKVQNRSYASYINPLLGDIAFHQQAPYNNQCPTVYGERTIVGCVAISMGQIMTYYQWPNRGQGSHSYVTETEALNVSANFNTTYDWTNILHYYEDGNYSTTQKNAVAKMLFHCGVSVNMDYGVGASGTSDIYVPKALAEYFSYDKGMQLHYRAMYNFNDWKNIIKEELNNNRPIIYCAQSDEGGHAFNCDGYDSNDYFHINWGWGGYYNGYYDLRYLDYENNEQSAFNRSHSIVTGIKPDKGDGTETKTELAHNLMLTYGAVISDNEITYQVFNMGAGTFTGDIATGIYYDGELVHKYIHYSDVECDPGYGDSNVSQDVSDWAMDNYEVQPIYRESGSSEWKPIPGENGMLSRWVYSDYWESWAYWNDDVAQFQVNSLTSIGNLSSDKAPSFELSFTSNSDFDYYGHIYLYITNSSGTQEYYSISKDVVVLAGETQTHQLHFADIITDGDYLIRAFVSMHNGWSNAMKDENGNNTFNITIGEGGSASTPILSLYKASEINKSSFYYGDELTYTAYINNTGDAGTVYLSIDLISEDGHWLYCLYQKYDYYLYSGYNEISLSGFLNNDTLSPGDYQVKIWCDVDENSVGWIEPTSYNACSFYYNGQTETDEPELEMVDVMQLNKTTFSPGERIEATCSLRNLGVSGDVRIGLSLASEDDNWYPEIGVGMSSYYFSENETKEITLLLDLPSDFALGTYELAVYRDDEDGQYYYISPTENSVVQIEVEEHSTSEYQFELVGDMQLNKTTFDRGETIEATYTIRNNGESRYLNLGISIADLYENKSYTDLDNTTQVYLPAYSDREITSTIVVPSDFEYGEYRIFAYYEDEVEGDYNFFIPIEFNAKHIVIEEKLPELEMVDPIQLNKTSFYPGEIVEASFTLKNIGYDGYVNVGLTITNSDGDLWQPELGDDMQVIYLSANSTKKLNFTIDIPRNFAVGTYSVIAYQEVEGEYYNIEPTENSIVFISVEEHDGKYDIYVTSNGNGEVVGAGRYEYGSEVTIAAIPDYGYKFYRWSDKNKENPRVVTVEGEATYEAEFRAITISLEAQPNDEAFEFVEWSDGETDNPRTISIAEEDELKYVAIFRMKETAIENAYITSAHVYSNSGNLYVIGAEDDYLVFDETGKLIYSGNENSIQLPSGVYLVRLGEEVQKVIVK